VVPRDGFGVVDQPETGGALLDDSVRRFVNAGIQLRQQHISARAGLTVRVNRGLICMG
jgi:hypothetical protein